MLRIILPVYIISKIKTEDLSHYNNDWLGTVCGFSELVVCPSSVEEVSAVLTYCNERRLAVVPQGK